MKMPPCPGRINIIGSCLSDCSRETAFELIEKRLDAGQGGYVCFTNVHTAVLGRQQPGFREITNRSLLSCADGKPLYWVGRMKGARNLAHMPGPDTMIDVLRAFSDRRHFFYGSRPETLERLCARLPQLVPGLQVCGALSPPFGPVSAEEREAHYAMIRDSGADLVWVGLGAPKQEQWMAQAAPELGNTILLGVGAAFDFYAGTVRRAPSGMRRLGLEWLYRLCQEPRRLWKRYLVTNSLFIGYALGDVLRDR
jgi:N-acetylglucosaminyldiphosphoundecaprenol N-acetyl-beta-D-mannosaminyltransferase